jgi:hypothetical protein
MTVIEVVEIARQTLPEDSRRSNSKSSVGADRETGSEDGTRLRRLVELELIAVRDVAGSALSILQDAILEGHDQDTFSIALPWL